MSVYPIRSPRRRCRGDRGQIGGIEVLPLAFLVLVGVALLWANAWAVIDARLTVTSAAREATRTYVEAPDGATASSTASASAASVLSGLGRDPGRATVAVPAPSEFGRCVRIAVSVGYEVESVAIPFLDALGDERAVAATFTELVDPFRGGLPGQAEC